GSADRSTVGARGASAGESPSDRVSVSAGGGSSAGASSPGSPTWNIRVNSPAAGADGSVAAPDGSPAAGGAFAPSSSAARNARVNSPGDDGSVRGSAGPDASPAGPDGV